MLNSKFSSFAILASLIPSSIAQTAPGFPLSASASLNVTYGTNNVSPAGELIPRPETANAPSISSPVFPSTGKGIIFLIDSDVPRNGTRVTLLHWLAPNVTMPSNNNSLLSIPLPGAAPYLQPSPPVGDIAHSYTFLLFSQPSNFSIPAQYSSIDPPTSDNARIGFNITQFISAAGLDSPIAANYIKVQNLTGVSGTATTFPPARPTSSMTANASSSVMPFPGTAATLESGRMVWGLAVGGLVAGFAALVL